MGLQRGPKWAEYPGLVTYFAQHRNRPEDLYSSEGRFLPWLANQASSVLDVGCAAGGFKPIWQHYRPGITYTGVDISHSLIAKARALHSDAEFYWGDCAEGLSLPDRCATVAQALGWVHWEPRYPAAIRELWRLADRYVFFDVRLAGSPDRSFRGEQKLAYTGQWDGVTTVPYLVLDWPPFAALLLDLEPVNILGYGYWARPAETVVGGDWEICFTAFVLEKPSVGQPTGLTTVCLDMPLRWPKELEDQVDLLPPSQLDVLAPPQAALP